MMVKILQQLGAQFLLNDRLITYEEIFAPTGLLPALSRRADQLCSLCLGYGMGVTFEEAQGSILGVKVIFDDITPVILRVLCLTDVICELIKSAPSSHAVPLDELMYD